MATGQADRSTSLERLDTEAFDLLVIGAGIIGARVAFEAASRGARVALVDARDFGGATSSASSKLIHGGLRYLQMGALRLVREALRERHVLLRTVAPHLVRPLTFVVPVYRGAPHGTAAIGAALVAYSALSGFRDSQVRLVDSGTARRLVPDLRTQGMAAAGVYQDAVTHDSRLVLATVTAAARAGAVVANYLPITELVTAGGQVVAARAGDLEIRCRSVVNAAGPWVDAVRLLEDPAARPMARLSKGVHVVLDQPAPWGAALAVPMERDRVTFAVPWEGMLLLGTTDTEYHGDPSTVTAGPEDVATVLREAAAGLPADLLARDRVRCVFAGLRVLPMGPGDTAAAVRDELVATGPRGMVSVAGGKLTTHRSIAIGVLRRIDEFRRARVSSEPLPGAGPLPPRPPEVEPRTWEHLTHLYGTEASAVAEAGLEPVHPDGPDVWGQVTHAVDHEWARSVDDVVRRRTTLRVRGLAGPAVRDAISATLAGRGVFTSADGR